MLILSRSTVRHAKKSTHQVPRLQSTHTYLRELREARLGAVLCRLGFSSPIGRAGVTAPPSASFPPNAPRARVIRLSLNDRTVAIRPSFPRSRPSYVRGAWRARRVPGSRSMQAACLTCRALLRGVESAHEAQGPGIFVQARGREAGSQPGPPAHAHTHTHTHTYASTLGRASAGRAL